MGNPIYGRSLSVLSFRLSLSPHVREARDNEEAEERSLRFGVEERNVWFMPENLSNSPLTKKT
jgi:hypothetical protein